MATDIKAVGDFVFREKADGLLELVGDFEGLYQSTPDPWFQSAKGNSPMSAYYTFSRTQIVGVINRRVRTEGSTKYMHGLEVGCGHGHVVHFLSHMTPTRFAGVDISPSAIAEASKWLPQYKFYVGNIIDPLPPPNETEGLYDIVVLGHVLWYVMHKMDVVIANCYELLRPGGMLVISQAFLKQPQRYGAEIAEGFAGAVKLLLKYPAFFQFVEARYQDGIGLPLNDGVFVLRKGSDAE